MSELNAEKNNYQVSWKFFDKLMQNSDYTKYDNMFEVVKDVYEKTYMYFSLLYQESLKEERHVTKKILEKNELIDKLNERIVLLEGILHEQGIDVPEDGA